MGRVYDGLTQVPGTCAGHLSTPSTSKPGEPVACVHLDEAPPGVDVRDPVSTDEAVRRTGAGPAAVAAANDLGVASPAAMATGSDVTCDGDGSSGYRVQAMYVVEAGKVNRYAELLPSLQQWAAGVDDVVNRSAAVTGGVRSVRWVHEPATTGCKATVLNVTVPAGKTANFNDTMSAVRAMGHTLPNRKYLMWTDATVYCGLGHLYSSDDRPGQDNLNNGTYAMYSRVDQACWAGRGGYSVETHELVHNFGGVQNSAPNSTKAGHCNDERDRMCYADGGSAGVMRYICADTHEALLDCNSDDYFSTYPVAGSYLAGRWNVANSRFLLGGGDGTNGGQAGKPTQTAVTVAVNPAVPGLPTQATATLALPEGRTATVTWKVANASCVIGDPTAEQTAITCPASTTAATTVTATAKDDLGATAVASATLSFAASTRRDVTVTPSVHGATGSYTACTGAYTALAGSVVDVVTGLPVFGVRTDVLRQTATMTAPAVLRSATTDRTGTARVDAPLSGSQSITARTLAVGPYNAAASVSSVAVTTQQCTAEVTMDADATDVYTGDVVTVSGTLTREGGTVPVPNQTVSVVKVSTTGTASPVAAVRTDASGRYRLSVKVLASARLRAQLPASSGFQAATSAPVDIVARPALTVLDGSVDRSSAYYRQTANVTGVLQRDAGGTLTPLAGATVTVKLTRPGSSYASTIASGRTDSTGTFRVPVMATTDGAWQVLYAGAPGQPAAVGALGTVTVLPWDTATTLSTSAAAVAYRAPLTVSGKVTVSAGRSAGSLAGPSIGVPVRIWLTPADGGPDLLVRSLTTTATGTFAATMYPTTSGTLRAVAGGVTGYSASSSESRSLTVE